MVIVLSTKIVVHHILVYANLAVFQNIYSLGKYFFLPGHPQLQLSNLAFHSSHNSVSLKTRSSCGIYANNFFFSQNKH